MNFLVADVGGTNTRIARTAAGRIDAASLAHLHNDDFTGFEALLQHYLAACPGPVPAACCIALAGPVEEGSARLTNRPWRIAAASVARMLGGAEVQLLNDLAALGHAIGTGSTQGLRRLAGSDAPPAARRQRLIVGVGTGFNVAPVVQDRAGGARVMAAEAGHAHLPCNVAGLLSERLGDGAAGFELVEDCFSGAGLARMHAHLHGETLAPAAIARSAHDGHTGARDTLGFFACLLGAQVQNLLLQHMPRGGVFLAGSVARAVVEAGGTEALARAAHAVPRYRELLGEVPLWLIEEDAAALRGCLARLSPEAAA